MSLFPIHGLGAARVTIAAGTTILAVAGLIAGCGGGSGNGTTAAAPTAASSATTAEVTPELAARVRRLIARARQSPAGTSQRQAMRIADAQAQLLLIGQRSPAAIQPLIAALKKPDYELILSLYSFYIQLGHPGSEKALLATLNHEGFSDRSSPMAFAFLASGNKQLIAGTRRWASDNGLTISGNPSGIAGVKWGQIGAGLPSVPTAPPPSP